MSCTQIDLHAECSSKGSYHFHRLLSQVIQEEGLFEIRPPQRLNYNLHSHPNLLLAKPAGNLRIRRSDESRHLCNRARMSGGDGSGAQRSRQGLHRGARQDRHRALYLRNVCMTMPIGHIRIWKERGTGQRPQQGTTRGRNRYVRWQALNRRHEGPRARWAANAKLFVGLEIDFVPNRKPLLLALFLCFAVISEHRSGARLRRNPGGIGRLALCKRIVSLVHGNSGRRVPQQLHF